MDLDFYLQEGNKKPVIPNYLKRRPDVIFSPSPLFFYIIFRKAMLMDCEFPRRDSLKNSLAYEVLMETLPACVCFPAKSKLLGFRRGKGGDGRKKIQK